LTWRGLCRHKKPLLFRLRPDPHKGCKGAPDFVVEIASPDTIKKDMKYKLSIYEKHGIPEYWIVHPEENIVMVYKLNEQKQYSRAEIYSQNDQIELILKDGKIMINTY
jgi:Uma2 family endonuclease